VYVPGFRALAWVLACLEVWAGDAAEGFVWYMGAWLLVFTSDDYRRCIQNILYEFVTEFEVFNGLGR
jgi:hypothetical protein